MDDRHAGKGGRLLRRKVAVTPQRIYAIVTKYTALRSFHAIKKKGTPLDYENAGVYTSELLDAFLDYRVMWKQLRITSEDFQRNVITLKTMSKTPLMAHYAQELKITTTSNSRAITPMRMWQLSLSRLHPQTQAPVVVPSPAILQALQDRCRSLTSPYSPTMLNPTRPTSSASSLPGGTADSR